MPLSALKNEQEKVVLSIMIQKQEFSDIEEIIKRAIEQNPHSRDILKAFQPIIVRQRRLAMPDSTVALDFSTIDKEKLKAGVPVIGQIDLLIPHETLGEIVLSLASSVEAGMPSQKKEIEKFSALFKNGKINLSDYFEAYPDQKEQTIDRWVEELQIMRAPVSFVLGLVARVILERRKKQIIEKLGEFLWEKGYCPICGEFPSIALIEEKGGRRFLHCSGCGHDWRFTRVVCPYCENEAPQGMSYFYIEDKQQEAAFICEKCRKYLITLNRVGDLFARDMDIAAISLIHLDMIMQDKKYEPMVWHAWNTFD